MCCVISNLCSYAVDPFLAHVSHDADQAGGLLAGSGELLTGIDPRVVDIPQSTTPKDVMQMYAVTRSSYMMAKPDASQAHGSLSNARSLMNGEWLIPRPWGVLLRTRRSPSGSRAVD